MFDFLRTGLIDIPWWGYILVALGLTHITIACVTLFLHRGQAHRALQFHPLVSHFMRAWLWLTTGMETKHWVAIHRKHHNACETKDDPHSPLHKGLLTVVLQGAELYKEESANQETLNTYGAGTPNDWIEKNIYTRYSAKGILAILFLEFILFGIPGISIWAVQMIWIPLFAAGIINGTGHAVGYRNFDTPDNATNICPIGLIIGGEELHNNHHAYPGSAKMSIKPWEFDIGWLYIRILKTLRLVEIKRIAPLPTNIGKLIATPDIHLDTAKDLFQNRLHVMAEYANMVMRPTFYTELKKAKSDGIHHLLRPIKKVFLSHENRINSSDRKQLEFMLTHNHAMETVYKFKHHLLVLWKEHRNNHENLKDALQEWCVQAEKTGLHVLQDFSFWVYGYQLREDKRCS